MAPDLKTAADVFSQDFTKGSPSGHRTCQCKITPKSSWCAHGKTPQLWRIFPMDDFSGKIPIKNMDDDELGVVRHDETETSMWVKRCHKPVVYTIYMSLYIYITYIYIHIYYTYIYIHIYYTYIYIYYTYIYIHIYYTYIYIYYTYIYIYYTYIYIYICII